MKPSFSKKPLRVVLASGFCLFLVHAKVVAKDAEALQVLQRMSTTLSGAKAFTYQAKTISEVEAKNGQNLTLFSTSDVAVKRPDKLRARFTGGAPHFDFFYDGNTASAVAPAQNVFSVSKAPPTLDAMLPAMENETGIRLVSKGLLVSDPYAFFAQGLTSATYAGQVSVAGVLCDHVAFRRPGVDWEMWLEANPRALPRRLVVTFTDEAKRPRTIVEFSEWNLHPSLRPSFFIFRQPPSAKEISFRSIIGR